MVGILGATVTDVEAIGEVDGRVDLPGGTLHATSPTEGRHGGVAGNSAGPL